MRTNTPNNFVLPDMDAGGTALCNAGNTVILQTAVGRAGMQFSVKRLGAGSPVTVNTQGGTIDGGASFSIAVQNQVRTFESDGTNWFIVSGYL